MAKISKIKMRETSEDEVERLHSFYDYSYNRGIRIKFNKLKIVNLLRDMGFFRYDVPGGTLSELVQIRDNRIRLVNIKDIRDAMEDYILRLPAVQRDYLDDNGETKSTYTIDSNILLSKLYDNLQILFSPDLLERLRPTGKIEIQEDDYMSKYLYYNNCAVKVTAEGIHTIQYKDLDKYIWENSIINQDYHEDVEIGDFESFIGDICRYDKTIPESVARKHSLMSIIGYLMHNNYEVNRRAILLTDVNEEGAGEANGGTGKGIIGKALGLMLNRERNDCRYLVVPGKGFEFKDTRYSGGDLTTQLIHLEDIEKRFDFEQLFNDVTDGCIFRKLHHNPEIHNAKILISVNHTINVFNSQSQRRRVIIFELANYYNSSYTPEDKYGRRFFESKWTQKDWNRFHTFMIRCVAEYMHNGISEPKLINYTNRLIQEQIPSEFLNFFSDKITPYLNDNLRIEINKRKSYEQFMRENPTFRCDQRTFTKWGTMYLKLSHIRSGHWRTRIAGEASEYFIINPLSNENITPIVG